MMQPPVELGEPVTGPSEHLPICPNDVRRAAARLGAHVHRTPVLRSTSLDALAGASLAFKAENLQRSGSFKVRGAFNACLSLSAQELARGVLTVSSGNHGQALALVAAEVGTRAVVIVPEDANPAKVAAARDYGADIVSDGVTLANREEYLRDYAAERDMTIVHPFDDLHVMAGQGTVALELVASSPPLDAVVVPVGGGGLISGVATVIKDAWPNTKVIGVEPRNAADAERSLRAQVRVSLEAPPDTVCDGVRAMSVGERPWEVIRRLVDDIVTVTEDEVIEATALSWSRLKSVVEPSGALPLAAVLSGKVGGAALALIVSGGNIDLGGLGRGRTAPRGT